MQASVRMFILALVASGSVGAQQVKSRSSKLANMLDGMRSTDLKTREAAFNDLYLFWNAGADEGRHPDESELVKLGLIRLLKTENKVLKENKARKIAPSGRPDEGYGESITFCSPKLFPR
jgi:hypothetical protein